MLIYGSGLRIGETANLRVEDMDPQNKCYSFFTITWHLCNIVELQYKLTYNKVNQLNKNT